MPLTWFGSRSTMKPGTARGREPRRKSSIPVHSGSGNVFEDLGLPDSAELQVKTGFAARIAAIMDERGLTQVATARLLGVHQADVSDLGRGKLQGFSMERLLRFLAALGQDVEIHLPEAHYAHRAGTLRLVEGTSPRTSQRVPHGREARSPRKTP